MPVAVVAFVERSEDFKMAALVDYAADSDSDDGSGAGPSEDHTLHLQGSMKSMEEMKDKMQLNIRPEVISKVNKQQQFLVFQFFGGGA